MDVKSFAMSVSPICFKNVKNFVRYEKENGGGN